MVTHTIKQRITAVALLIVFLLLSHTHAANAQSGAEIFQLVNQFRLNNGLPAFQYNATLATAAQNQANYMAANMVFSSHVGAGGSTPQSRANAAGYVGFVVENIVGGTGMTASKGIIWWQNSAVHYNTLVTQRYTEAGAAYATNGNENFYVLVVGRRSDAPPPRDTPNNSPEPLFITPIVLAEPREDGSIVHTVQDGQALWSLAAHYEVKLSELLLYNGLKENAFLQPGQEVVIRLADGADPPPTPTPPLTHVVEEGQSLWSVAIRYDLRLGDLLWYNNLTEESVLQPGETLIIRLADGQAPPPTPTPIVDHAVREGQTLWEVALTYGLTLDELLALNGITADAIIQPGDMLRVRQPDPTVTPTSLPPTVTPESAADTVSLASAPVAATATATPQAISRLAAPTPTPAVETAVANNGSSSVLMGVLIVAFGLVVLAFVGIIYLRQQV